MGTPTLTRLGLAIELPSPYVCVCHAALGIICSQATTPMRMSGYTTGIK